MSESSFRCHSFVNSILKFQSQNLFIMSNNYRFETLQLPCWTRTDPTKIPELFQFIRRPSYGVQLAEAWRKKNSFFFGLKEFWLTSIPESWNPLKDVFEKRIAALKVEWLP